MAESATGMAEWDTGNAAMGRSWDKLLSSSLQKVQGAKYWNCLVHSAPNQVPPILSKDFRASQLLISYSHLPCPCPYTLYVLCGNPPNRIKRYLGSEVHGTLNAQLSYFTCFGTYCLLQLTWCPITHTPEQLMHYNIYSLPE